MNINDFNDKVVEIGKRIFGDSYSFSSTYVSSTMYGHIPERATTYRAVIFYGSGSLNISAESTDLDLVLEMLEMKYKEFNAKQSIIEL